MKRISDSYTWLACRNFDGVMWKGPDHPCIMDDCGGVPTRPTTIVNPAGQDFPHV